MRALLRRFHRALGLIPRRVRWILTIPAVLIALSLINGRLAISVFFAALAWLAVLEKKFPDSENYRGAGRLRSRTFGEPCADRDKTIETPAEILDGMINPATGLMMSGGIDTGGNSYGCGRGHDF